MRVRGKDGAGVTQGTPHPLTVGGWCHHYLCEEPSPFSPGGFYSSGNTQSRPIGRLACLSNQKHVFPKCWTLPWAGPGAGLCTRRGEVQNPKGDN